MALVVLLLFGLPGCGRSDALSRPAAARLQPPVAAIRAAAAADDRARATAAAAELRVVVADLRKTGEITTQQASEILAAGAQVEAHLALLSVPPPEITTSTTTEPDGQRPETTTSTTTEPDGQHRDKGKDRGDDKRENDD